MINTTQPLGWAVLATQHRGHIFSAQCAYTMQQLYIIMVLYGKYHLNHQVSTALVYCTIIQLPILQFQHF